MVELVLRTQFDWGHWFCLVGKVLKDEFIRTKHLCGASNLCAALMLTV